MESKGLQFKMLRVKTGFSVTDADLPTTVDAPLESEGWAVDNKPNNPLDGTGQQNDEIEIMIPNHAATNPSNESRNNRREGRAQAPRRQPRTYGSHYRQPPRFPAPTRTSRGRGNRNPALRYNGPNYRYRGYNGPHHRQPRPLPNQQSHGALEPRPHQNIQTPPPMLPSFIPFPVPMMGCQNQNQGLNANANNINTNTNAVPNNWQNNLPRMFPFNLFN